MYPLEKFRIGQLKNMRLSSHSSSGNPFFYKLAICPFCIYLQKFIPNYVSPNAITWIGFISMMTGFLAILRFDSDLSNPPRLLSLLSAFSILVYILTDSIDGIHARNTKQSTQLGKIVDHFVDSFAVFAAWVSLSSALRLGFSITAFFYLFCMLLGFYLAELGEKYSGCLKFSSISGCVEGLLSIVALHIVSIVNPKFCTSILHSNMFILQETKFLILHSLMAVYIISLVLSLFYDFYHHQKKTPYKIFFCDLLRVFVLVFCMIPIVVLEDLPSSMKLFYLVTLSQGFSICYLEEYVSIMSKSTVNPKPFLFSFFITIFQGFLLLSNNITSNHSFVFFIISSAHFFLRSGSILKGLSRHFNSGLFY